MTAAEFIDLILTPVFAGIGVFIGVRIVARRNNSTGTAQATPRWMAPAAGLSVCLLIFATKIAKV